MKIGQTRSVGGSAGVTRLRPTAGVTKAATVARAAPVNDSATVMGIPEAEFTPKVREAIVSLLEEVSKLRQELEDSKKRITHLEKLADEDALVAYAQRYGGQISVLYFDINDMKSINDSHGHAAGDAAIAHVADLLAANIRESDVVGRLGGDEFGIILANAPESEAIQIAENLAGAISGTPFEWKGRKLTVSISSGAYALKGGEDASAMLDQADRAMYARKPAASQGAS
jgi:diguanylate cyclase (GGDEF)-like protein